MNIRSREQGSALVEGAIVSLLFFSVVFLSFEVVRLFYLGSVANTLASCAARTAMVEVPEDGLSPTQPLAKNIVWNGSEAYLPSYRNYIKSSYCDSGGSSSICSGGNNLTYQIRELKAFNICLGHARDLLPNYKTLQARTKATWENLEDALRADPRQLWIVPEAQPTASGPSSYPDQNKGYFIRSQNNRSEPHPAGIPGVVLSDSQEVRAYTACIGTSILGTQKVCKTVRSNGRT